MVGLIIPVVIARFRLVATELILISTVLCRGLALYFMLKYHTPKLPCVPIIYEIARKYYGFTLMTTDLILFRSNFFTMMFVALPIHIFLAGLNQ